MNRMVQTLGAGVLMLVVALATASSDTQAQPTESLTQSCGTESGTGCAPSSARIDLAVPVFTDPTRVDNPWNPIGELPSVLMVGTVDGKPFRTEVTLLPDTKVIDWPATPTTALVSQYVAFVDGRIEETAFDWYAQADDGGLWYLGEDVSNYEDGVVADTEGSWTAGIEGPGGLITPADPQVGQVYRPENIPGLVFEEVTVSETGRTVDGPMGPVERAFDVSELHQDQTTEVKTFAPGYGEFFTSDGTDVEALALAVPTDSATGTMPAELEQLTAAALAALDAIGAGDWAAAGRHEEAIRGAWTALDPAVTPRLIAPVVDDALERLAQGIADQDAVVAGRAAIELARSAGDIELRFVPPYTIDQARFGLHAREVVLDAAADDAAGVLADTTAMELTFPRFAHTLGDADRSRLEAALADLRTAADAEDLASAARTATSLR